MIYLIILFLLSSSFAISKEYSLEELLNLAESNSGYSKQESHFSKIAELESEELNSNYYPQFSVDAQATYQSDIFELPLNIPGMSIPSLRKDQYNINLNLNQVIYDGSAIAKGVELTDISAAANIETSKTKIRNVVENVASLYYAASKLNASAKIIETTIKTLESNKLQIKSLVDNGVLLRSNLDALEIQISSRLQTKQTILSDYNNLLISISRLCGINNLTSLQEGKIAIPTNDEIKINRNEILALEKYQEMNLKKSDLNYTSTTPKVFAFARLGYGNPNMFNMFNQEWSEFYMVGIKFSWKPFSWFSESQNLKAVALKNENLEIDKQEFLRQLNIQLEKENSEITKAESLISQDAIILDLQKKIIADKYAQLTNGTATVNDYLSELNSLELYETNFSIHNIMLESAKNNLLIKSGNFKGKLK